jgi:hypothetical protein
MTLDSLVGMLSKVFVDIEPHQKRTFEFELPAGRFEVLDLAHGLLLVLFMEGQGSEAQSTQIQLSDGRFCVLNRATGPKEMDIGVGRFAFRQAGEMPPGQHSLEIEIHMDERGRF